jgi:hypothetical protein
MKRHLPLLALVAASALVAGAQTFIAFKVVVLW